ncbi:MAG: hypothetical protein IJT53_02025 [Prevotella sp.]|nr:hypothetical protein [Prevotella sp.]
MDKQFTFEELEKQAAYQLEHAWDRYFEQTHDLLMRHLQKRREERRRKAG